ncbi:MAG: hypothetical protein H7067_03430 [Burkholderiales bacterium]|nr:hypothetical protein [Opitutaceae bacterium]
MGYRSRLFALTAAFFLGGHPSACPRLQAEPVWAEQPALAFFSSVTEREFARLQAASIKPSSRRHGPFRVPAPGFAIDTPALHILDLRCAPEDWTKVMEAFARWQELPSARPTHLALPDGRLFAFSSAPRADERGLSGLVRIAAAEPRPNTLHTLRLVHDRSSSLVLELRSLPERPAFSSVPSAPSESEAPSTP